MKIRIQGNTLRLRLKKSELAILADESKVSDIISFADSILVYSLEISSTEKINASFSNNTVKVFIPKEIALNWIKTDLVSLSNTENTPSILIEKDFKCTSESCSETEAEKKDSFLNPNEKC